MCTHNVHFSMSLVRLARHLGRASLAEQALKSLSNSTPLNPGLLDQNYRYSFWHTCSRHRVHTAPAVQQQQQPTQAVDSSAAAVQVLYKGRGMRLFRVLVRLKVFQLAGVAALAVPINTFLATGDVSGSHAAIAAALVLGAGVASTALWYYSRRYIGELALLPGPPQRVRLSVLDFWGNREDVVVPLAAVVPPLHALPEAALRTALLDPLLPLDVEGHRQYFLSVRYGHVLHAAALRALLTGQLEGQQMQAAEAERGAGPS